MKRICFLLLGVLQTGAGSAQFHLIGTAYTQDFDNLGSGLPPGWRVYTGATATQAGTADTLIANTVTWSNTGTGFKNYASANALPAGAAGTDQGNAADRALGVRQTGTAGYDPGAAFVFIIARTTGLSHFQLSFKLQSLLTSSGSRLTTWTVDYGFGDTPSVFTPATAAGTLTTGDNIFANNTVTVDFGADIDNHPGPVWIRVVTLAAATGSGSRTASAIDDFALTWTGNSTGSERPTVVALSPANGAQYVLATGTPVITFNRQVQKGTAGNIYITNETAQRTDTIPVTAAGVTVSGYTATVGGVTLSPGSMYHITFDSVAFDTAGYTAFGIYDTAAWRFSTAPEVLTVTALQETFDNACAGNGLPAGWAKVSRKGSQQWQCHTAYGIVSYRISAYSGGHYHENEDWLITPRVDLTAQGQASLVFRQYKRRAGAEPAVLVSHGFPGYGDVSGAAWTDLQVPMPAADTAGWYTYTADLAPYVSQPFFIAFRYTSTDNDGYEIRIDSVVTAGGSNHVAYADGDVAGLTVAGIPARYSIPLVFYMKRAGAYTIAVSDLTGRSIYRYTGHALSGRQRYEIRGVDLPPGMYLIRLGYAGGYEMVKAVVP